VKRSTPATEAAKKHMARIKAMPCVCCRFLGFEQATETEVHHIREDREARNDFLTIPLCWSCHQGPNGIHGDKTFLSVLKISELGLLAKVIEEL
jgi:Recombination enhancement, RecA-dependent nuclease